MTRTARAALAALTALAAVAAIIAADLTPPASAQSEESSGRIVARLLEDGRVEFGWQPAGGARVLPTKRYFPASIDHQRWLRSSPVEVDGAAIGRIEARQTEDGRIEFAFTPTDGERIEPQARYFPADARVGRWLRSTEIAIGPAAPRYRYIAISAGPNHACAIRTSGEIACWGGTSWGDQTDAPDGSYTAVSAGWYHSCAIRASNGAIACWGRSIVPHENFQSAPPQGSFTAISAKSSHACAIRTSGEIECWERNDFGQTDAPSGSYTAVSAGGLHTCAIRENGAIECWGAPSVLGYRVTDAPEGSYTAISARSHNTCAI